MTFEWDKIQRSEGGKVLLLYRHQRVFDEELIRPGMDVLDVGGWGVFAQAVIESGARCTVLDLFTPDQYYANRVRALPHVVGDARDASHFALGTFDVITCFEMLEHCGGVAEVLANAHAWLREGGAFVGTIPIPGESHPVGEPGIEFFTDAEFSMLLVRAGFVDVRVEPTGGINKDDRPCSLYFVGRKR